MVREWKTSLLGGTPLCEEIQEPLGLISFMFSLLYYPDQFCGT